MANSKGKIAIVGAGIGGMCAGVFLSRLGFEVAIYDQASRFARVGAGIQQTPNAMKVHRKLGTEARLKQTAYTSPAGLSRVWDTGETTNQLPMGEAIEQKYGAPYLLMHRADLHAAIESVLPPGLVRFNHKLVGIDQNASQVTLAFADGSRVPGMIPAGEMQKLLDAPPAK